MTHGRELYMGRMAPPETRVWERACLRGLARLGGMKTPHADASENCVVLAFTAKRPPLISLPAYVRRCVTYLAPDNADGRQPSYGESVWMHALCLLRRLDARNCGVLFSTLTIHRLWITAVCVAGKCIEDRFFYNDYVADVGGISNAELNRLELLFCDLLGWELFVESTVVTGKGPTTDRVDQRI